MIRQANKWTEERDREPDYDQMAIVPHFASLDDDDWFLPDFASGAKIDSRTFSIAADVCQDGTGIWCDRPMTPANEEAQRQRERLLNQERKDRERAAAKRGRADAKEAAKALAVILERAEIEARRAAQQERADRDRAEAQEAKARRPVLTPTQTRRAERERYWKEREAKVPDSVIKFVVDESAGFFDLVRGVFPTDPKVIWCGVTNTGKKVSVRGNGETFYGWPGENK